MFGRAQIFITAHTPAFLHLSGKAQRPCDFKNGVTWDGLRFGRQVHKMARPFTGELAGTVGGVGLTNKSMGRGLRVRAMARTRQLGKVEASCIGWLGMISLSLWALPLTTRLITNPPATSERIRCIRLECVECLDFCLNLQPTFCYVLTAYSSTSSSLYPQSSTTISSNSFLPAAWPMRNPGTGKMALIQYLQHSGKLRHAGSQIFPFANSIFFQRWTSTTVQKPRHGVASCPVITIPVLIGTCP